MGVDETTKKLIELNRQKALQKRASKIRQKLSTRSSGADSNAQLFKSRQDYLDSKVHNSNKFGMISPGYLQDCLMQHRSEFTPLPNNFNSSEKNTKSLKESMVTTPKMERKTFIKKSITFNKTLPGQESEKENILKKTTLLPQSKNLSTSLSSSMNPTIENARMLEPPSKFVDSDQNSSFRNLSKIEVIDNLSETELMTLDLSELGNSQARLITQDENSNLLEETYMNTQDFNDFLPTEKNNNKSAQNLTYMKTQDLDLLLDDQTFQNNSLSLKTLTKSEEQIEHDTFSLADEDFNDTFTTSDADIMTDLSLPSLQLSGSIPDEDFDMTFTTEITEEDNTMVDMSLATLEQTVIDDGLDSFEKEVMDLPMSDGVKKSVLKTQLN